MYSVSKEDLHAMQVSVCSTCSNNTEPNEGDECMIPERNQDSTSGLNAQINIGQDMATCAEGSICVQIARGVYRCQIDNCEHILV